MTNELRDDPLVPQAEPGGGCSIPPPGERPKRKPIPLKARLEACLLLLKIDPKELLGTTGITVDADFKVVSQEMKMIETQPAEDWSV